MHHPYLNEGKNQEYLLALSELTKGAIELLWIKENDCIWIPNPEGDIHEQRGQAVVRIKNFTTFMSVPAIYMRFHQPGRSNNVTDPAESIAAIIDVDNVNDRVWQYYRKAIHATTEEEATFESIITIAKPHTEEELMERLRELIEVDGQRPAMVGAIFLRCRLLGYISRNPTEREARASFKLDGIKWSGVENYMSTKESKRTQPDGRIKMDESLGMKKAQTFNIFPDDGSILEIYG